MLFQKKRDPDPEKCECADLTQVDGEGDKYHPRDANGRRTGHDPRCEHYVPPPHRRRGRD